MVLDYDIFIIGGGLNGPALALALAQAGFHVGLADSLPAAQRKAPNFDGRAYALALTSQRLLAALGVWRAVADYAQPIAEIKVSDGRDGQGPLSPWVLQFHQDEIETGPMGFMIEDRHLRRAFLAAMDANPRIRHYAAETVTEQNVSSNHITVTLALGRTLRATLLVGADGRRSGTARRAGIRRMGWNYGQTAIVCAVGHEKPHHGIAHQFFTPAGPLAILPLAGEHCSIVWTETTARADRIMTYNDADFLQALRPVFGSFLGELQLAGVRFSYPLGLSLAEGFVADRVALVGDAAHGIHPLAGQGLNAGLRDVAALAQVATKARQRGEDFGTIQVLERYQRWRRFDTVTLALATDTFNRLFSNDNPLLRLVRGAGLGLVNAAPGLRRGLIREAAGLSGDLPHLLRGKAL